MHIRTLIAIEAALFGVAGLIIWFIVSPPFGGPDAPAAVERRAEGGPDEPALVLAGTPAPAPTPEPSPAVAPDACGPPVTGEYLRRNMVLSYYGNPHSPHMGILGEMEPEALAARLKEHAALYESLSPDRGVRPALHIVYAIAQFHPGNDGDYLLYIDNETMREYLDLACENEMLVFLDLQIGRSDVETEVRHVLRFLELPHVHLALDPEFAMPPGEVPGQTIGSLDAEDVNKAQEIVQQLTREKGLGEKIVVVHQFLDEMLTRRELLRNYPDVRLVIDMDGFGPQHIKRVKYEWYARFTEYPGIKLFFQHDPDLMTETEVLELEPAVVIYQ
jgi:hypothetical protein